MAALYSSPLRCRMRGRCAPAWLAQDLKTLLHIDFLDTGR